MRSTFQILLIFSSYFMLFSCNDRPVYNSAAEESIVVRIDSLEKQMIYNEEDESNEQKAIQFILQNINYHKYLSGPKTSDYLTIIHKLSQNDSALIVAIDSLRKLNLVDTLAYDALEINAVSLLRNQETAFATFNKCAWKKTISPAIFYNYVLPYRIQKETLTDENWRNYFTNLYLQQSSDSSIYTLRLEEAAAILQSWLFNRKKKFKILPGSQLELPDLPVTTLDKMGIGTCNELTLVGASVMRSFGIPASIDFTPCYLNMNAGHQWNCIVTGNESFLPFDVTTNRLYTFKQPQDRLSKVYRLGYQANKTNHFHQRGECNFLPAFLNDATVQDVTSLYIETANINIKVNPGSFKPEYCYLSVFRQGTWDVSAWGKTSTNILSFQSVGLGGVYLPLYIESTGTAPAAPPVIVDLAGRLTYLKPNRLKGRKVKLTRKFPLSERKELYLKKMIGGIFQASNDSTFTNPVVLHEIKENPGEHFNEIKLPVNNGFRYIRYVAPTNGHGNVAEIELYQNSPTDTFKINGRIIGSLGSIDPFTKKEAAIDGNILSFFCSTDPGLCWVGLDLGKQMKVGKLRFLARNDMNSIQVGHEYELFFWDDTWVSLGRKKAEEAFLLYENVPDNALMWLKCYSEGKEERIFTYQENKQIWW